MPRIAVGATECRCRTIHAGRDAAAQVSGVGHCAEGACGAVVESGWRGNETAHLTNEPPCRAGSEQSEDHPLDDTICAARSPVRSAPPR